MPALHRRLALHSKPVAIDAETTGFGALGGVGPIRPVSGSLAGIASVWIEHKPGKNGED